MRPPPPIIDLANLSETERISVLRAAIADLAPGHTIGFVVIDNKTADRYLRKLGTETQLESRTPTGVSSMVLVKVGRRPGKVH